MLSLLSDSCKGYEAAALRLAMDAQGQGLTSGLTPALLPGLAQGQASGLGPGSAQGPGLGLALDPFPLGLRVVGVVRRLILSLVMRAPTFDAQRMQVQGVI